MPRVEVIVPWRPGCEHRERAWEWIQRRYGHPIRVGTAPPGPWVKALAVMPAIAASPADVVVAADADVWTDGLDAAIAAVDAGAGWAVPHGEVHRLTDEGTRAVVAGGNWHVQPLAQRPYHGVAGGGIIVAHRETLLDIPLDPRFVGWGQEDECWAMALTLVGPAWRGNANLIHLYHPPQERLSRRRGSAEGWNLRRRYLRARHSPAVMLQLVDEAKHALPPHRPPLHDHAPDLVR